MQIDHVYLKDEQITYQHDFTLEEAKSVNKFHRSFPQYEPTPLVSLKTLARQLGVEEILVKDESKRFGLNAFKVLGGSYAIARIIQERLQLEDTPNFESLKSPEIRAKLGEITFITATDGNHGRGVAWAAKQLGFHSVVYLPKGSASERLENIRRLGAQAEITSLNYDDTVRLAAAHAREHGWIMVQDTDWEGYQDIPRWIMQGYISMAYEAYQSWDQEPTHIFLQAGVGAMSGAVAAFLYSVCQVKPTIAIVEPDKADCIFRTAQADDGRLHLVEGDLDSIMAGLCCGEPSAMGWQSLRAHARHFFSVTDDVAMLGMRQLAHPMGDDPVVVSGESGAVTLGLVCALLERPELWSIARDMGLNEHSRILCFSTEGDTDKENYQKIIQTENQR